MKIINNIFFTILILISLFIFTGCADNSSEDINDNVVSTQPNINIGEVNYENSCYLNTENCNEGYIIASINDDKSKYKLQLINGDNSVNYTLTPNKISIIPINMGNGEYTFRLMKNTTNNKYVEIESDKKNVTLYNEFSPYLIPNLFCEFNEDSECVKLAKELNQEENVIDNIYNWVVSNIDYDEEKAENISQSNLKEYTPNPDETLKVKEGICFDYASLLAAMLRSVGIPTKICVGYYNTTGIYHAWNQIYINNEWKDIKLDLENNSWNLVDPTFSSDIEGYTPLNKDYKEIHCY